MIGLCVVFLIIILIIEILLLLFRDNIVIIKMNRVFPLVIPSIYNIFIIYYYLYSYFLSFYYYNLLHHLNDSDRQSNLL